MRVRYLRMPDPSAAAAELDRCAAQLGFPGVMLNGYQNVGNAATGWYYDHEALPAVLGTRRGTRRACLPASARPLPETRESTRGTRNYSAPCRPSPSRPPPTRRA